MSLYLPPRNDVLWTPPAVPLGADFLCYRLRRRPARTPAFPWSDVAELGVPTGYTPATVEQQHTRFADYEPGWSFPGGQWADGWDYAISAVAASTGFETPVPPVDTMNQLAPDTGYWAVSNLSPYFNFPLPSVPQWDSADDQSKMWVGTAAGRDEALIRVAAELPYRTLDLVFRDFARVGEDGIRTWRAAAAAGATMTLHSVRGDRSIGGFSAPSSGHHDASGVVSWQGKHIETARDGNYVLADYNLPAGLVFNGSSHRITIPDNALLNPGSGDFSVVVYGLLSPTTPRFAISKGNIGTSDGYGIGTVTGQANMLRFWLDGASTGAGGGPSEINTAWFDQPRVAIGTYTSGAQSLYRDGLVVATSSLVAGAITNTEAMLLGGNHGAAPTNFMALAPFIAAAYYPRKLTDAEAFAASGALLGYPNMRMPAGASLFLDLRDDRCWSGVGGLTDLSGNGLVPTVVNAPPTRGIPWPLSLIDRF